MSVVEFQSWTPDRNADRRWQLINGAPVCMAPASENHGSIQAEAGFLLTSHLRSCRPGCRVVMAPGVIPRVSATKNLRIPDLGVTCAPATGSQAMQDPLVLLEILSPSNAAITRDNVWAYTTIPSVMEILLLGSLAVGAELLRRDADGSWPEEPVSIGAHDQVVLQSIGFSVPLISFYRTTNLLRNATSVVS
jgi:Uma2 family endonuclease